MTSTVAPRGDDPPYPPVTVHADLIAKAATVSGPHARSVPAAGVSVPGELREPSVLDALLRPTTVAMIGASRDPKALGGRPLGFMARYGFPGRVYPVNGKGGEVQGVPAYASVLDIPEPVDLALIMVRAALVPGVLRECASAGVRAVVIMSSGFGEGTGAGAGLLESVADELAASGMRILGPNCEGLASLPADAPLTFSPVLDIDASGVQLNPGNIAVLSQSGGMGFAVAQWGTAVGLDFSYIISTGNEYDLDCLELAGQLVDTPETEVVAMLLESVRDLAEFADVGARFRAAGKRLVVAKLGKSEPGARGAYAHTRHVAGDIEEYRRLFRAYGITEAADEEDLIDVVQAIANAADMPEEAAQDIQIILDDQYSDFDAAAMGEETEFSDDSYYEERSTDDRAWREEWENFERALKTEARFFSRTAAAHLASIFQGIETMSARDGRPLVIEAGPGTAMTAPAQNVRIGGR